MSESRRRSSGDASPAAVIHKRILDAAADRPEASTEAIAADIAGASPALVEQVLEEYGDPGEGEDAGSTPTDGEPTPTSDGTDDEPDREALTDAQRETLRAIRADPSATQAELAETLGVSKATVNRRVNAIEGFDWSDRRAFVERVLPEPEPTADTDHQEMSESNAQTNGTIEQLERRIADLEAAVGTDEQLQLTFEDAEFAARVVHACLRSDRITEEEELRLLEGLME